MSCQSGRSLAGAVLLAGAAIPALCGAQAVSWAHQNGSLQSNGSITIKSQSGGSYAGQVNPAGAVAKANQSAVTQPPTVIIQATSGGYSETIPLFVQGTSTLPNCPTGYSVLFSASSSTWGATPPTITNAGGSRYTLGGGYYSGNGQPYFGWLLDSYPTIQYSGNMLNLMTPTGFGQWNSVSQWAARLCTK